MERSLARLLPLVMVLPLVLNGTGARADQQQPSQGEKLSNTPQHSNMQLVGTNDLQARSTYQPVVHKQGGRYILYAGHHALGTNPVTGQPLPAFNNEPNGTSLVDVTDPNNSVYLAHIPVGIPPA